MKFTLSWLKDHLETEASLDEITEALTDLGHEVEGVENPDDTLGAFRICRVIEAKQHPNADRLRLCRVETWPEGPDGESEEVQVVCGAPNARTGLVGVFAAPGTYVPGTDLLLKPGEIRGVESNGMLCSERELMLSDDHEGIIDLPEDAPLGAKYIDYAQVNDPVIEIAITPNRPDALGVYGIARDLAARGLGKLKPAPSAQIEGLFDCPISVSIDKDARTDGCEVFMGRLIRGVKNGPSPKWLQDRLRAIGLRPISALVDVTNFFTFDQNRPLHVFDADKVDGDLRVHRTKGGEKLIGLDEKEYVFEPGMVVISDDQGVESIGGIMGGLATGCTQETTNVFLEAAVWETIQIASTGRALKINSDARYRNERGIDPEFNAPAIELATKMIIELCGGEPSHVVAAGAVPKTARAYPFDPKKVESLVGMSIPKETQVETLKALGFKLAGRGGSVKVSPPSWRPDVKGEADLVEEIARVASLTRLQAQPMPRTHVGVARPVLTPMQKRTATARRALAAAGLNEAVTYVFISEAAAKLFGGGEAARKLENPISSDMSDMRPSPLPALLEAAARNQARGFGDVGLFEVGAEFFGAEPGEQREVAAGLRVGQAAPREWSGARRPIDLYDAKADAEALLAAIGVPTDKLMIDRETPAHFHPGRSARLKLGPKTVLAEFGELHPKVLKGLDVKGPAVAFTVYLEAAPFPKAKSKARPALEIHDLQAVERDFAFVVDERVEAETVLRAARAAEKKLIDGAHVFDVFEGPKAAEQLGAGKKSIAISVRLQPKTKTLTEEEIEAVAAKVVASVGKAAGATLRG